MSTVNQYSKLFQVLSEVLETCTVPEVITALNSLNPTLAPLKKKAAPLSQKRQVANFTAMITQGIRGTKPEHLKKTK